MSIEEHLLQTINASEDKYGAFASTHEALGVITEEYWELVRAIHANDSVSISLEAADLAAACIRLAEQAGSSRHEFASRSGL